MNRTITFMPPAPLLSMNDRHHWAVQGRYVKAWRTAAFVAARAAGLRDMPACVVTITLPVKDRRRRDPHNFTPTLKACIDGLVSAWVWPDDNAEWVTTTEPVLKVGVTYVTITLTPRKPQ